MEVLSIGHRRWQRGGAEAEGWQRIATPGEGEAGLEKKKKGLKGRGL